MHDVDAIVLAGGRGRRMGGETKPLVEVNGEPMLHQVIRRLKEMAPHQVVVVAPDSIPVPQWCLQTLEGPPLGGPVAGISAGLGALASDPAELVAVLATDAPWSPTLLPLLKRAVTADGAITVTSDGRDQPMPGVYVRDSLVRALATLPTTRHASLRHVLSELDLARVNDPGGYARDFDTPDDIASATL